jgi:hypothetical protein
MTRYLDSLIRKLRWAESHGDRVAAILLAQRIQRELAR